MSDHRLAKPSLCTWLVAGALLLSSCSQTRQVTDGALPERDVVFQPHAANYGQGPYYPNEMRVGFLNADGRGVAYVTLTDEGVAPVLQPTWTGDGGLLVFADNRRATLLAITASGELRRYRWGTRGRAAPVMGQRQVVMFIGSDPEGFICLFDLESGKVSRTLVTEREAVLQVGTNPVHGPHLVFGRWWEVGPDTRQVVNEIVLLDVERQTGRVLVHRQGTGSETELLLPAFSPDGEWVAYTAADGIYLIRPDGTDNRAVLTTSMIRQSTGVDIPDIWGLWPPAASWSPDSRQLLYHRCQLVDGRPCGYEVEGYGIYKLDLRTLDEELLLKGGLHPYWRLPMGAEIGS